VNLDRTSGILLHPTSLSSSYGIGDFGPAAYDFIDFLKSSGQSLWQMLPTGPTGYGDSPYQSLSAFAGNAMLISPDLLIEEGLLTTEDLEALIFSAERVEYENVIPYKNRLLKKAFEHFKRQPDHRFHAPYQAFCAEQKQWLDDFTLFLTLKSQHKNRPWTEWPAPLRMRQPKALAKFAVSFDDEIELNRFIQFLFFYQFEQLHRYAAEHQVKLIGDMPIFVAHDSSDVWSHPEWFKLDKQGEPTVVAGVPPDYFSETGQRWGNPLFNWEVLQAEGYSFWIDRVSQLSKMFDFVRIDHFRGFASYWEIPADEETALNGQWKSGPGKDLFDAIEAALGEETAIIAEDLGIITQDVTDLLDALPYPGMAVLQFGFESMASDDASSFLPHNLKVNQVVYTGTHDNDTVWGWWNKQPEEVHDFLRRYLNTDANSIHMDMIRVAFSTVCTMAIFPAQDLLGLGSEACMNRPGTTDGNWQWRLIQTRLDEAVAADLLSLTMLYGRNSR